MVNTSVTENSRNSRPASPPMNSSGMNAAISDMLIDTTVKPIWRALAIAAASGDSPLSMLRKVFSIMTIASSTTNPTETASAISERLSIEKPASHIAAQVPASDSGTVMPTARVGVRRRKNANTTSITTTTVAASVSCMSRMLARIISVRSVRIEILIPAGTQCFSSGNNAWMRSTVSTTLASACLVTLISTAGTPLYQATERLLRVLCSMEATDPSSVTAPFADRTTMLRYSDRSRSSLLTAMVWAMPSLSNSPTGPVALALTMARRTSSISMPILAIATGLTRTRTAGCSAPDTVTSPTPSTCDKRWASTVSAIS